MAIAVEGIGRSWLYDDNCNTASLPCILWRLRPAARMDLAIANGTLERPFMLLLSLLLLAGIFTLVLGLLHFFLVTQQQTAILREIGAVQRWESASGGFA